MKTVLTDTRQAAAVARLMMGEFKTWDDFYTARVIAGSRDLRRAQAKHDRKTLAIEVQRWCQQNFEALQERKLTELCGEVVIASRTANAFRLPRTEFETRFSKIRDAVCRDAPPHATVSISLWGLQFEFPEDHFCKDLVVSASMLDEQIATLDDLKKLPRGSLNKRKKEIASIIQKEKMLVRNIIVSCFRLLETYLNGIAWDFLRTCNADASISRNDKKLLSDRGASFDDKLQKYQIRIFSENIVNEDDVSLRYILDVLKPIRDSLMHPSPTSDPERFGGKSKLDIIYGLDVEHAAWSCLHTLSLIQAYENRRIGRNPIWLADSLKHLSQSFGQQNIGTDNWYRQPIIR